MLKIAICDDDIRFTSRLEDLLLEEAKRRGIQADVAVFYDGSTLTDSVGWGEGYDLIFLDIEMKKQNGIEAARFIRRTDKTVLLIFISCHEQYWKELFEVEPFRFLSKPLDEALLFKYFQEACVRIREKNAYFHFSFRKERKKVVLKDVIYFESRNRVISIILTGGRTERFYGKLNDVEKGLKDNQHFLRIHQSFLVNYDYIRRMRVSSLSIDMGDGRQYELQISEDRQKKIKKQLEQMLIREEEKG